MAIDGTWNITLNTLMGPQTRTLTLSSAGGTLSGSMAGPQGNNPIEEVTRDGNALSWSVMAPQLGMKIGFSATVEGDSMSGQAQLGAFGAAPFTGSRA